VTLLLADFRDRENFGPFLSRRGLNGSAVEIGTHRAHFTHAFLVRWNGRLLYCVDPYTTPPGYEGQADDLKRLWKTDGDRDKDYRHAKDKLSWLAPRYTFVRKCSHEAAPTFLNNSLDFVYLDGDHRRDMVRHDLLLWWPKVKSGGIIAGHDFICPGEPGGGWGKDIQMAVHDFTMGTGSDVYLVPETKAEPWSFYIEKP